MPNRPRRRWLLVAGGVLVAFALFVFCNNVSFGTGSERRQVLAHRGLAQTFPSEGLENDTCTAERIDPPRHRYLENTIASMAAAYDAGADVVEFDVHRTADDDFAVFHDWDVGCRTDGSGKVEEHTMAELRELDIGHGYTADGGRTHPFRDKGVGLMPSLDQVLDRFGGRELLLHLKSEGPRDGALLAERIEALPERTRSRLSAYGGDAQIAELNRRIPTLRVMSKRTMKDCLLRYAAGGWSGHVPEACRNTELHLPENVAPWLWGWPGRFTERMRAVGTRVVLTAKGDGFSAGFDRPGDLERVPAGFDGMLWTNRAEALIPALGG